MDAMSRTDVEGLERRLQKLEDIEAIRQLKYRYLRACDRKQPDVVRDCFIPDGAFIDAANMGVHEGRDSFINIFTEIGCRDDVIDMHHGQNGVIDITGQNEAHASWDLFFHTIHLATRMAVQVAGYYEDDYVRRDGRWWISKSVFRVASTLMLEVKEDGEIRNLLLGR